MRYNDLDISQQSYIIGAIALTTYDLPELRIDYCLQVENPQVFVNKHGAAFLLNTSDLLSVAKSLHDNA